VTEPCDLRLTLHVNHRHGFFGTGTKHEMLLIETTQCATCCYFTLFQPTPLKEHKCGVKENLFVEFIA
jgi:hypothetical protein